MYTQSRSAAVTYDTDTWTLSLARPDLFHTLHLNNAKIDVSPEIQEIQCSAVDNTGPYRRQVYVNEKKNQLFKYDETDGRKI